MASDPRLFSTGDLAEFCQVDVKTIHNWVDRGEIQYFRTPGRHVRFQRNAVVDFLRKYGYPVPQEVAQVTASVALVEESKATIAAITAALGNRFEICDFRHPIDAIVSVGGRPHDALVIDLRVGGVDTTVMLKRLREISSTSHMRTVAMSADPVDKDLAMEAADGFVQHGDWPALRQVLAELLGL